jgi:TetR/AcrR family transcriptional repressor of nem operon
MRYEAGRKEQTRAKIIRAAGKVFRRDGYHASGVDKVMEEAGLTAGGFYAHFASKEALFADMLAPAAAETRISRDMDLEGVTGPSWVEAFLERYLGVEHLGKPEDGCPLPALVSEVARADGPVRASFEAIVREFAARLQDQAGGDVSEDHALAIVALCVGGLGVARAVRDESLGERILGACRDLARLGLIAESDSRSPTRAREEK